MEGLDRETADRLHIHFRKHREGIRNCRELASLCLICGSIHIVPKDGEPGMLVCRNCGFAFYRGVCPDCGAIIDGRDPKNNICRSCLEHRCSCGACGCRRDGTGESA